MFGNGLSYVGVVVRDVPAVAEILERDFELPRANLRIGDSNGEAPVFPLGETALALFELGDPFVRGVERTGVHHMAIAVEEVDEAVKEATDLGIPAVSSTAEPGLGSSRRVLLDPAVTGGIVTFLSDPLDLPVEADRDGEVRQIDHLGVASASNPQAVDVFVRRMGWPVESTENDIEFSTKTESFTSDKYGAVLRNHPPELIGGSTWFSLPWLAWTWSCWKTWSHVPWGQSTTARRAAPVRTREPSVATSSPVDQACITPASGSGTSMVCYRSWTRGG